MNLILLCSLLINFLINSADSQTAFIKTTCPETISIDNIHITNHKWELQEIRFVYNNEKYYYKQDDYSESNIRFDGDHIIFNCDGTGIYHQANNIDFGLTWHYKENKKNAIEYTIFKFRNNSDLTVNWENIELSNNSIKYTEYYTHKNGIPTLGYGIRNCRDLEKPVTDLIVAN